MSNEQRASKRPLDVALESVEIRERWYRVRRLPVPEEIRKTAAVLRRLTQTSLGDAEVLNRE